MTTRGIRFAGIQRTSTLDFPGCLAAVLFVRGCDMDCFYCHNRALLSPDGADLAADETERFLEKRRGLLDGIVLSGGEPTLYPGLIAFMRELHEIGYRVKLDTNGQRPDVVAALLEQGAADYVAVDWKAPRTEYEAVTGRDGWAAARETLSALAESGIPFEARTTLYPGLTGEGLLGLAAELPPLPCYRLNFYRVPERYRPADEVRIYGAALTPAQIREWEPKLRQVQPNLVF